jgi:hypothetical protein
VRLTILTIVFTMCATAFRLRPPPPVLRNKKPCLLCGKQG